jgi:protein-S-isoprenylcysteine O-methyltransferase Ste14
MLSMEPAPQSSFGRRRLPATLSGCRYAAANLAVSLVFVVGALPSALHYGTRFADFIFAGGAIAMSIFALLRSPPSASSFSLGAVCAFLGMALMPALLNTSLPRAGAAYSLAAALELLGVGLSMAGRIWMGRAFGILPANRGIVSDGPFGWMRHPVYAGWLILMAGYAMSYHDPRNALIAAAAVPFAIWRISLEEGLLSRDPHYQRYRERVPFRLLPGLY